MCDYSLAGMSNRLAVAGEQLVVHRFPTGSLGLVSSRRRLREILFPSSAVAVCIPPGARLLLQDIPEQLRRQLAVCSAEEVTFTQRSAEAHVHRDCVRFRNGKELLLQQLRCAQRVTVLSLGSEEPGAATESRARRLGATATLA
jgi:hypothetical protein